MIIPSKTFQDNYQYYLNEIHYKALQVGPIKETITSHIIDDLIFNTMDGKHLKIEITRSVTFEPSVLYELSVSYGAVLTVLENVDSIEQTDWKEEFRKDPICSNVLQALLSRISMQIAQITSSYGQHPLVTPPNLMK